jgi:hypothetical protein
MREYLKISIDREVLWPNKDTPRLGTPLWTIKIPIPKLGGDACSRNLTKLLKKRRAR